MTASHFIFLAVVLLIIVTMAMKRNVAVVAMFGIAVLAFASANAGSGVVSRSVFAIQAVFRAMLMVGSELFDVALVIAIMLAMLRSLQAQGVEERMVAPLLKIARGRWSTFLLIAVVTYVMSIFFWPSPSVALVGAMLLPVAARVKLPAIASAVAINLAGHGMAIAADPVIQLPTRLAASAAGVPNGMILTYSTLFSTVIGLVALPIAAFLLRRDIASGKLPVESEEAGMARHEQPLPEEACAPREPGRHSIFLAILVPVVLFAVAGLMIFRAIWDPANAIEGSGATALLGGTGLILLLVSTFLHCGLAASEVVVEHLTEGLTFGAEILAPVLPIVGFFLLGDPAHATALLGPGTPGFLLDIGKLIAGSLHGNTALMAPGIMVIGFIAGLDGSGLAGVPLTGSVAGALMAGSAHNAAILASLGQVASIWTGGGVLVPWSSVLVVAGITGVTPVELARRNFIPVLCGFVVTAALAVVLMH